jgi:RNA 3'-terminal phosphate cyclase
VTFLGKKDPITFSKDNGDFVEEGEKSGTMTVRFKPTAAGEAKVAGTYKMSVCSADQCQIEIQPIALAVPVD